VFLQFTQVLSNFHSCGLRKEFLLHFNLITVSLNDQSSFMWVCVGLHFGLVRSELKLQC